jgi:hypothetical protein
LPEKKQFGEMMMQIQNDHSSIFLLIEGIANEDDKIKMIINR